MVFTQSDTLVTDHKSNRRFGQLSFTPPSTLLTPLMGFLWHHLGLKESRLELHVGDFLTFCDKGLEALGKQRLAWHKAIATGLDWSVYSVHGCKRCCTPTQTTAAPGHVFFCWHTVKSTCRGYSTSPRVFWPPPNQWSMKTCRIRVQIRNTWAWPGRRMTCAGQGHLFPSWTSGELQVLRSGKVNNLTGGKKKKYNIPS